MVRSPTKDTFNLSWTLFISNQKTEKVKNTTNNIGKITVLRTNPGLRVRSISTIKVEDNLSEPKIPESIVPLEYEILSKEYSAVFSTRASA